jgi:hypothetical protein
VTTKLVVAGELTAVVLWRLLAEKIDLLKKPLPNDDLEWISVPKLCASPRGLTVEGTRPLHRPCPRDPRIRFKLSRAGVRPCSDARLHIPVSHMRKSIDNRRVDRHPRRLQLQRHDLRNLETRPVMLRNRSKYGVPRTENTGRGGTIRVCSRMRFVEVRNCHAFDGLKIHKATPAPAASLTTRRLKRLLLRPLHTDFISFVPTIYLQPTQFSFASLSALLPMGQNATQRAGRVAWHTCLSHADRGFSFPGTVQPAREQ